MRKKAILFTVLFFTALTIFAQKPVVSINGELKKWHKVTLSFNGDNFSENGKENPFLNYRLNVTFKHGNKAYTIPGFFAADGNASETSADNGNIWKVRFTPDEVGEWTYKVSFRKGNAIAVSDDLNFGEAISFDGEKGTFLIAESDKKGKDFRAKGRLNVTGGRYLQFQDSKEYFIKGGADSPENFLGYYEFDQTPPNHKYQPHAKDWKNGDPTWQNGKGKNIIGALNYLASKDMNSVYFLTMNVQGDGKDVWPWNDVNERYRFDCSKLDQWEIIFDHMDQLGLMLHIVTQETENELLLDIGETKTQRKLYYRELIARFSHHLGVTWNLGEENGPVHWSPKGQDDKDRKAMAKYIKTHDPYKNLVVLHTHSIPKEQDIFLNPLLGYEYLDGPSVQTHKPEIVHEQLVKWISESQKNGKQWVVCQDEIGPADTGAKPDADDPEHNEIRAQVLWGNLMAGGAGVEWYFGYKYAHNDLNCEDWRSRENVWDQTKIALDFFQKNVPFTEMKSADGLTENEDDYVFAGNGKVYVIYLPKIIETKINLKGTNSKYSIKWFNPRIGGELQNGTVKSVKGGAIVSVGFPPNKEKDWVAILKTKKTSKKISNTPKTVLFNAVNDFEINTSSDAIYYKDTNNGALAINAAKESYRNKFASSLVVFNQAAGLYDGVFSSMTENDGESEYRISINGSVVYEIVNPKTAKSFENISHKLDRVYLEMGDIIEVESKAVTNGEIPEGDETAWSRGRWNSITFNPYKKSITAILKDVEPFKEKNGLLEIEAENFHYSTNNGTKREWYIRSKNRVGSVDFDNLEDHTDSASNNAYIEALPDTRVTHDDELIEGENFFPIAGIGGIVSYKISIKSPGKYFVWTRAYSSGAEDNGIHVGVNETWPESGARIQLCEGKNEWTWSSAQRVPENHCGEPQTISLNFEKKGDYIISFSMREDGFELDKWILSKDKNFNPND